MLFDEFVVVLVEDLYLLMLVDCWLCKLIDYLFDDLVDKLLLFEFVWCVGISECSLMWFVMREFGMSLGDWC